MQIDDTVQQQIIGTWRLVQYTMLPEGSREPFYPYGKEALGILIYTSDTVSVHIMRADRSPRENRMEEMMESAENYGGYVGRYEIESDRIIHYPELCGFLDFLQTPQVRFFTLQEDRLILTCTSFNKEKKKQMFSELIWVKTKRPELLP